MTKLPVLQQIGHQAEQKPDQIAIRAPGQPREQLTYQELVDTARTVAVHLLKLGVRAGDKVGVLADTTTTSVAALLGIWQAGAAYLALDRGNPPQRTRMILDDAQPSIIIAAESHSDQFPGTPMVSLSQLTTPIQPNKVDVSDAPTGRYAYVCYTSGTSGLPKGVLVPHDGVTRLVRADVGSIGAADVVLCFAPLAFDASTFEIWSALSAGATLVVAPAGSSLDDLRHLIAAEKVTVAWFTAGLFRQIAAGPLEELSTLRVVLAGGDVVSPIAANRLFDHCRGLTVINGYGPTENTTFSTSYRLTTRTNTDTVPIGYPLEGDTAHLLDDGLQAVSDDSAELYVGGSGLADGYLGNAALTAQRFVADPTAFGERMYRTGDHCRARPNGALEFLGRVDRQVKIRGFRVEPLEVEHTLQSLPELSSAIVITVDTVHGDRRIAAFVTAASGQRISTLAIRRHLHDRLMPAAVPTTITPMKDFPLTRNGKVDYAALAALATNRRPDLSAEFRAPASDVEREIASIWQDCLGIDQIGVDDDFFELGGHSLLGMQVTADVSRLFGTQIRSRDFYLDPTVAGLCRRLETLPAGPADQTVNR